MDVIKLFYRIKKIVTFLRIHKNPVKYYKKQGVKIGENTTIHSHSNFDSEPYLISIGSNVRVSYGVRFVTHDGGVAVIRNLYNIGNCGLYNSISVGNNVFIGNYATIMPGVKIGNNVIIAFGSIVTKDIPDNEVWGGIPAKKIETIEEYYEKNKERLLFTNKNGESLKGKDKKEFIINYFNQNQNN